MLPTVDLCRPKYVCHYGCNMQLSFAIPQQQKHINVCGFVSHKGWFVRLPDGSNLKKVTKAAACIHQKFKFVHGDTKFVLHKSIFCIFLMWDLIMKTCIDET